MPSTTTKPLSQSEADHYLRVTKQRHNAMKYLALDHNTTLIDIADKVIAAGLESFGAHRVREDSTHVTSPSN